MIVEVAKGKYVEEQFWIIKDKFEQFWIMMINKEQ